MHNKTVRTFALLLAVAGTLSGQSGSVQNAADRLPESLLEYTSSGGFISGTLFNVDGLQLPQLAPRSLAIITSFNPISVPGSLSPAATVSLRSAGSATLLPAQVIATDPIAITFVVPPDSPTGPAQLIYNVSGMTNWIEVAIVPARFAFYRNANPGPPLAQQFAANGAVSLNGLANPAQPGQAVALWGSGLGGTPAADITVALGGVPQTVQFAGASPNLPGVDQINIQIAPGTPQGCYVPLVLTYGTKTTSSFLSVTQDGSACRHPFQLSAGALKALDLGGTIAVGSIDIASGLVVATGDHASRQESAGVSFSLIAAGQIAAALFPLPVQLGCVLPSPVVATGISGFLAYDVSFSRLNFGSMTLMSQGASLPLKPLAGRLQSPTGSPTSFAAMLPAAINTPFGSLPPSSLPPGQWTWSGSGGDYPASSFPFAVPELLRLAGSIPLTLVRTQDQTISWNGSALDSKAIVTLTLTGATQALLTCVAAVGAGSIVIPKALLAQLDPATATLTARVTQVSPVSSATILLNNGSPLVMMAHPASSESRPVDIQ